jgi:hypothetical protein
MRKTKSEASAKAEFVESAAGMYERLRAWRKAHPLASFDELAEAVGQERRALVGQLLGELATQEEQSRIRGSLACPACGQALAGKGLRSRGISDPEGEVRIEREYYSCPTCEGGLFPPGHRVETDETCVE